MNNRMYLFLCVCAALTAGSLCASDGGGHRTTVQASAPWIKAHGTGVAIQAGQQFVADACVSRLENPDESFLWLPFGCSITNKEAVEAAAFAATNPVVQIMQGGDGALINALTVAQVKSGLKRGAVALGAGKAEQLAWWALNKAKLKDRVQSLIEKHPNIAWACKPVVRYLTFKGVVWSAKTANECATGLLP